MIRNEKILIDAELAELYGVEAKVLNQAVKRNLNRFPNDFSLSQNYPNPFNPSTVISYRSPVIGFVTLKVYDILGSEVATLVNEEKPSGEYEVEFDGSILPTGVYFYQLQAGEYVETRKMVLLR